MNRALRLLCASFLVLTFLNGCSSCTPPQPIVIEITPSAPTVQAGGTVAFTAGVTGTEDTDVAWSVQEGASGGAVTTAGAYTAPVAAGTYHVIAALVSDPTEHAVATVTVTALPAASVTMSPVEATVATGGTVQFAATVSGLEDTAVVWSVQEGDAGGTISTSGLYTSPATGGLYHIVATSAASSVFSAAGEVTVNARVSHSSAINADETWIADYTVHAVTTSIAVGNGATLTIEPGARVEFSNGAAVRCGDGSVGSIIAVGVSGNEIVFTSSSAAPVAGAWLGIRFYSGSAATAALSYCAIEWAGGSSSYPGAVYLSGAAVTIDHCLIRDSARYGIDCVSGGHPIGFTGNTITGCAQYPIMAIAEYVKDLGEGNTLTGNTQEGIAVDGGTVATSGTWSDQGVPYVVTDDLYINGLNSPVLTIEAGTVLKFSATMGIRVGYNNPGGLAAVGTADAPITFTAISASPLPGAWDGLRFYSQTLASSEMEYCGVDYAGGNSSYDGAIYLSSAAVTVRNCAIRNSARYGIAYASGGGHLLGFTGNTVSGCGLYPLMVDAEWVRELGTGNVLTGNTQEGIEVPGGTVVTSGTWRNQGVPYAVTYDVYINAPSSSPVVTIEAGTVLKFSATMGIRVGYNNPGGLAAVGTADAPITFTAISASPLPGAWDGLRFYSQTLASSEMEYCGVDYAGGNSSYDGAIYLSSAAVTVRNCAIRNSARYGIAYASGGGHLLGFTGNTVSGCGLYPLMVDAEWVRELGTGNVLTGNTQEGIEVPGGTVVTSGTWRNQGVPYAVTYDVYINDVDSPVLTIEAGTVLKFSATMGIRVGYNNPGGLIAQESAGEYVTFTATSGSAGGWDGLRFYSPTVSSSLSASRIEYGGGDSGYPGNIWISGTTNISVAGCTISDSARYGIYLDDPPHPVPAELRSGNTIQNCPSGDINL